MSHIQRQAAVVAQLEPIFSQRLKDGYLGCDGAAKISRILRPHILEMRALGYTQQEAAESAQQCRDMASLNAGHAHFEASFGVAA